MFTDHPESYRKKVTSPQRKTQFRATLTLQGEDDRQYRLPLMMHGFTRLASDVLPNSTNSNLRKKVLMCCFNYPWIDFLSFREFLVPGGWGMLLPTYTLPHFILQQFSVIASSSDNCHHNSAGDNTSPTHSFIGHKQQRPTTTLFSPHKSPFKLDIMQQWVEHY